MNQVIFAVLVRIRNSRGSFNSSSFFPSLFHVTNSFLVDFHLYTLCAGSSGSFYWMTRKSYIESEEYKKMNNVLKKIKEGLTYEEKKSLAFRG